MKKLLLALTIAAFLNGTAQAAEESNIYVLPAVLKSSDINNNIFEEIFKKNITFFKNTFVNNFKKEFENTTPEFSDAKRYNTFVAYLTIPRVSQNNIGGTKSVKVYLPMTATLNFANMVTSEILYSESFSERIEYTTSTENAKSADNLTDIYKKGFEDIVSNVVKKAREEFKPFAIELKVADNYKNLYILDKGLNDGIAKDDIVFDEENNQLVILHSELSYSIANPLLGKAKKDSVFKKYSNSSLTQIKKPKILFANEIKNDKIYNLFSSALGGNADFSLMAVNKSFVNMQKALEAENEKFSTSSNNNRQIPDYFIRLYNISRVHSKYPTNQSYQDIDKYAGLTCANIFNKQGEVVYSTCATDEITDEDVNSRKFSQDYQTEILVKNIFGKLAEDLAKNVKFKTAQIPIAKTKDNTITLKDTNHILNIGDEIAIMRKVKTDKISSDVTIPTWSYKVSNINGGSVEAKALYMLADDVPNPSKKDFVIATAISQSKPKIPSYNFITGNSEIKGNELKLNGFEDLAFNIISANINLPVSVNSEQFKEQIDILNNNDFGFARKLEYVENNNEKTVETKYKVNLLEEKKKGTLLEQKYEVTCGLIVKDTQSGEPKKKGIKQQITIKVPSGDKKIVEYELLKHMIPLLKSIAQDFK